jgi:hypothetical protein
LRSQRDESPHQIPKSLNTARGKEQHKAAESMVSPRNVSHRYTNENGDPINKPATPYDERVIPTLRNSNNRSRMDNPLAESKNNANGNNSHHANTSMRINEENEPGEMLNQQSEMYPNNTESMEPETYDPMDGTEEMTEREVREAALMNDFLGKQIVIITLFSLYSYYDLSFRI